MTPQRVFPTPPQEVVEEVNTSVFSTDTPRSEVAFLVFEIASHWCGLSVSDVQEIVPLPEFAHAPGEAGAIAGFMNLRGKAVPAIDAARLFGMRPSPRGLHTPLVVLKGSQAALLVDTVFEIARFSPASLQPVPADSCFNNCTTAQVKTDGGVVNVLSRERLLLEKERQYVAELQLEAQRRLDELEGGRP